MAGDLTTADLKRIINALEAENMRLRIALGEAEADFLAIRDMPPHGAADTTLISRLRSGASSGLQRARSALTRSTIKNETRHD